MDNHDYYGTAADKFFAGFWQKAALWFMGFMLLALLAVAPKKKEDAKKEDSKAIGDMMVRIVWPNFNVDIDLWVKSPDDERPVGYSNKSGKTFDLIHDDLGFAGDSLGRNEEIALTRGLPAGEYIINVQYFRNQETNKNLEVPVKVVISTRTNNPMNLGMRELITSDVVLHKEGEQITVVRFVIKEDGELDRESVNEFYQELRQWQPPIN